MHKSHLLQCHFDFHQHIWKITNICGYNQIHFSFLSVWFFPNICDHFQIDIFELCKWKYPHILALTQIFTTPNEVAHCCLCLLLSLTHFCLAQIQIKTGKLVATWG